MKLTIHVINGGRVVWAILYLNSFNVAKFCTFFCLTSISKITIYDETGTECNTFGSHCVKLLLTVFSGQFKRSPLIAFHMNRNFVFRSFDDGINSPFKWKYANSFRWVHAGSAEKRIAHSIDWWCHSTDNKMSDRYFSNCSYLFYTSFLVARKTGPISSFKFQSFLTFKRYSLFKFRTTTKSGTNLNCACQLTSFSVPDQSILSVLKVCIFQLWYNGSASNKKGANHLFGSISRFPWILWHLM